MTDRIDPALDLSISRVIHAPRNAVWTAWTTPETFEQWWIPAPAVCRVAAMDLRPGGAFQTLMSEDGSDFVPHMTGCFLAVDPGERIIFTTALVAGFRPAADPFITAVFTLTDHSLGTEYVATALHPTSAVRELHEELGFYEGWDAVTAQLAALVENTE
ncbi:SRPBCC family protein [Glaciihabitans sp. dw_435]|uniref:SRPBCC family protein n=1 Tax=Glaciihabitans sp. dw_435 TaxID=2720081 RepID=UPI001BD64A42|nr:SRPBCC family protein [Glaciihabitans sp. dw_435]